MPDTLADSIQRSDAQIPATTGESDEIIERSTQPQETSISTSEPSPDSPTILVGTGSPIDAEHGNDSKQVTIEGGMAAC